MCTTWPTRKRSVWPTCRSDAADFGSPQPIADQKRADQPTANERRSVNPASTMFGAGVAVRNALYDRRIFKAHKLARPVVSIGNISVGGTGKTPFVIALGELLKA